MADILWRVFGESAPGQAHEHLQDAIFWIEPGEGWSFAILAVADGHGSAKAFRSDCGANLAVRSAAIGIKDFLSLAVSLPSLTAIKRSASEDLPRNLVRQWTEEVRQHLTESPFTVEELSTLETKSGKAARELVDANPLLAYGSTVLVAAVNDSFALYAQLGDGDIVCVSDEGEPTRPMPRDDRLFANETTSLCTPEAWRDFRVQFQVFLERRPALIMLSTDGYANSYQNDDGFLRVGSDILEAIRSDGEDKVRESLAGGLRETSDKGSGDDITLGLIVKVGATKMEGDHGTSAGH